MKKTVSLILTAALCVLAVPADAARDLWAEYPWAAESVEYCLNNDIISGDENGDLDLGANLTRAQMARIFTDAFSLDETEASPFDDVKTTDWFYSYSLSLKDSMPKQGSEFNGGEYVTREEFAATMVKASGGKAADSSDEPVHARR